MKKRIITILSVLTLLFSVIGLVACGKDPIQNFNVYFNVDGEVVETISTNGNESISIPNDPEKTGYEFDGWYWDKDIWSKPFTANSFLDAPISSNMSVYCKWKAIEYTASFYADNVFVDDAKFTIEDSIIKNVPNVPNKEGYTGEWDNYTIKAENIRVDAIYAINKYTVTWKNYDGTILETDYDVEYNTTANYDGQMPTRNKDAEFTYTFNGWSPNVGAVKGDTIYTAQYSTTTNTYTVTWKNFDGTPLEIDNDVPYGTMPSFDGENPTKPTTQQYTFNFNGWDKTVDIVKSDIEYTAVFNSVTNKYSVTFYDEDGSTELGKSTVNYGTNANYPNATPLKEQDNGYTYTFAKWVTEKDGSIEDDLTNVIDNRSVYANYTPTARIYNVYFNENGGSQISDTTYIYGIGLTVLPTASDITREGYTFDGWFINEQKITEIGVTEYGDKTLTAKWTAITYTATFYADGQKVGTATFTVEDSEISGVPEVPDKVGYDKKWEDYTIIANDIDINAEYTPITYTITYLNTKNAINTNETSYTIESDTITLLDIFETGYDFDGWYDGDNKVTKIEKGSYGDKILTAKWTAIKYDLVLHFEEEQGHYAESASNPTYYTIEDEFDFVGLESNSVGRTFIGWFTSKNNGQGQKVTGITLGSIGKIELYAQWELEEYSITYHNVNNATNLNATTYNIETETFTINDLTLIGYDFIGWFSDEKLETPATTTIIKGSNGDLTFYAKWKAIDYTITYELYGGEILNGTNPITYTIEDEITFIEPTLLGNTFIGWFTLAENGAQITGIEKGSVGNITVYARYISFESNGGSAVSYTLQINNGKLVAPENPTKEYYDFNCWCTDVGLTEKYDFDIPTKNLILYAKWVPTAYKINYVLNGGVNNKDNPSTYTILDKVEIKNASKTGYTFMGWFTDELFTSTVVSQINKGSYGEITLYANYRINQYTISFETNGGTTVANITQNYNTEVSAPESPAKNGYTFGGWYSDETLKTPYTFSKMPAENIMLYAKWNLATYQIKYNLDGGTNNNGNKTSFTINSNDITLYEATKQGYNFAGWFTDNEFKSQITKIEKGSYGDKELFAKWEVITYTITYVVPNGTVNNNIKEYTVATNLTTLENATLSGYTFNGWFSDEEFKTSVTTIAGGTIGDITIYGKFTANTYTVNLDGTDEAIYEVSFNLNGAEGTAPATQTVTETNKLKYLTIPTRTGFLFAGWFEMEDCQGLAFDFSAVVRKDTVLYAKWVEIGENKPIAMNGKENVTLNGNNEIIYVFVPLVSGNVTITTTGNYDTYGALYNSVGVKLVQDDDTGVDSNFQIVYNVTANKPYYIHVRAYSSSITGTAVLSVAGNNTVLDGGYTVTASKTTVTFGEDFELTVPSAREGYKFLGYFDDNDVQYAGVDGKSVKKWDKAEDSILYTKWERTVYTITFVTNGGSTVEKATLAFGDRLDLNDYVTTRTGYSFKGWFLNASDTEPYNASTMPDYNLTLNAKWTSFALGEMKYNQDKKDISVNDTISGELFGIQCIDTDGNDATISVLNINGEQTAGNTITIIFKATSGNKTKQLTISNVKVYGMPSITVTNTSKDYINENEFTASAWGASGKDTFGNSTTIKVYVDGEYKAGDIVTLNIDSVDKAGNITRQQIQNVKVYGKPVIIYNTEKNAISVNDTLNAELFTATAVDSFGEPLSVSVTKYSGTISSGNTVTIRISATDSKGNITNIDVSCKVYGMPTISNATTTEFKVEDNITAEALGITATDTYNNPLAIVLSTKDSQTAGNVMTITATVTDIAGNIVTKDYSVKIYGIPTITVERDSIKVTENPVGNTLECVLSFDSQGGSSVASQTITKTQGMVYPEIPTRSGYAFKGWYTSSDCTTLFDFSKDISEDTTVYAGWEQMVTSGYYSRSYIDARKYNNSSNAYSMSNSGTSSSKDSYTYFTALTSGTYYLCYKSSSSSYSYGTWLYVYNATKGSTIMTNSNIYSTSYTYSSVSFTANAGDVIYVSIYGYNNSEIFYMYITGANTPSASGKYQNRNNPLKAVATDSFGEDLNITVSLNSAYKDYVLTGGTTVKYDLTATDHLGNVAKVTTKEIKVYDVDDIKLNYNAFLNDRIKLSSKGEEFEASATDNFGENCDITIEPVEGYELEGGKIINLYVVATDRAGNSVKSDLISDIKVYGMPTIMQIAEYIDKTTDLYTLFMVKDSFNEELSYEAEIVKDYGDNNVQLKVTAVDDCGNIAEKYFNFLKEYSITYNLNGGVNSSDNPSKYTAADEIVLQSPTKVKSEKEISVVSKGNGNYDVTKDITEYTFLGWYLERGFTNKIEKITTGSTGNKTLYAKWSESTTTTTTTTTEQAYKRDGNYIYFGTYPQSDVTSSMGSTLSSYVENLPTNGNNNGWTSYKYYISSRNSTDFMWYKDVDVDSNGTLDYRAVYFTSYRPYQTTSSSSSSNSYQYDNGYYISNVYWFKFEPIKWRILEEKDGKATLLAELILDSQDYNYTDGSRTIGGKKVYGNNYEYSNIRAWLNDNFYNTAFNDLQKGIINTVTVDNSARSTNPDNNATAFSNGNNSYACSNTQDKVWLLSEQEVTRASYGFSTDDYTNDTIRQKKNSGYAKCMGAKTSKDSGYVGNGDWWLRSPYYGTYYDACRVRDGGKSSYSYFVNSTYYGVVPALEITL